MPWLSIVPIAESRSSYNGLIILVFLICSGTLTAMVIHRFATRATRRSAIWDCGYPLDAAADAIHQFELRHADPARVRDGGVQRARSASTCRGRARRAPAISTSGCSIRPGASSTGRSRARLRTARCGSTDLQFLTIRRYLTLVFCALIAPALVVAAWR